MARLRSTRFSRCDASSIRLAACDSGLIPFIANMNVHKVSVKAWCRTYEKRLSRAMSFFSYFFLQLLACFLTSAEPTLTVCTRSSRGSIDPPSCSCSPLLFAICASKCTRNQLFHVCFIINTSSTRISGIYTLATPRASPFHRPKFVRTSNILYFRTSFSFRR